MPLGVYKRTEKHCRAISEGILRSPKLPRTQKQTETSYRNLQKALEVAHKLPRTVAQIENARKVGLNNHANMIVKHHNDLCHGTLRPDDVTYMTSSEHMRLHAKLDGKRRCRFQRRDNKGKFIAS